jgi:Fe-S cluster biogenesis protein NfuA
MNPVGKLPFHAAPGIPRTSSWFEMVRPEPALRRSGPTDIYLKGVDVETGVVSVELVGACISCPASSQTLKEGLERILTQRVEGVTAVEHVGETLVGADGGGTAVTL